MTKMLKKVGLSIALASAFGVSANAACDSIFCIGGNVGIGGVYSDFGGNGGGDGNFKGGYGALDVNLIFIRRLQLGLGLKAGAGLMDISGSGIASLPSSNKTAFDNASLRVGFNVASLESPLYINALIDHTIEFGFGNSLIRGIGVVGGEIAGKKRLSEKMRLLYSIGGGVAIAMYDFDGMPTQFIHPANDKFGYSIFGSLGAEYALTSNLGFYIKGIAKYYDVAAVQTNDNAMSFPAAKAWSVMAETGLSF